ncbi:shikimate dehydrogenase family protein [Sphingomonas sp.]|uniref:shikimate dehydrogenase family protein n=1 Tax=Sphingomonas sp. TaxID=28214 RepID=UPI002DD6A227|nr:shikimate dehydrogenase [Sphingomonas sp.]
MAVSGSTRVIGFIGSSYEKSRIYDIYNKAFDALALDFVYVPFHVADIAAACDAIRALGIHAAGVTIPFKVSAMPLLDSIDDAARRTGAVNFIVNTDGRLHGGNTDGAGAVRALEEAAPVARRRVCILGSGGAARAIAADLLSAEATVHLVSVDPRECTALTQSVGGEGHDWKDLAREVRAADIVINSTPIGMAGTSMEGETPVPGTLLRTGQIVMDLVTAPSETPLMREARDQGAQVVTGERMLRWQALLKLPHFTGAVLTPDQRERFLADSF